MTERVGGHSTRQRLRPRDDVFLFLDECEQAGLTVNHNRQCVTAH